MAGNQNSGGARAGAGRKKKPLADRVKEGKDLKVVTFENLEETAMPTPNKILSDRQKDGTELQAVEIYESVWKWLEARGCVTLISPQVLDRYAMTTARWVHCEEIISREGYLGQHPTTGGEIQSPFVSMSRNYLTQSNRLWAEIFNIVRENSLGEFQNPHEDKMEQLFRKKM